MSNEKKPSRALATQVIFAALTALKENGGQLPRADVIKEVEKRMNFDEWASEHYEKTGNQRWWAGRQCRLAV